MTDYAAERSRHDVPVNLVITTKVPSKWRMVDLETGDVWAWGSAEWVRADDVDLLERRLARARALLKLFHPDEMTPTAFRMLNEALDAT